MGLCKEVSGFTGVLAGCKRLQKGYWWPCQESNLDLEFRKLLFYPLNYKARGLYFGRANLKDFCHKTSSCSLVRGNGYTKTNHGKYQPYHKDGVRNAQDLVFSVKHLAQVVNIRDHVVVERLLVAHDVVHAFLEFL